MVNLTFNLSSTASDLDVPLCINTLDYNGFLLIYGFIMVFLLLVMFYLSLLRGGYIEGVGSKSLVIKTVLFHLSYTAVLLFGVLLFYIYIL